uniref:Uncharacterized protein n=1 Tax=Spongospora subterranea TaxID=70186 RepID=A0A0H5RBI8_9EUKA|eukprot:CRZ10992.1 hypothetical protein [Spongospora subterranea]
MSFVHHDHMLLYYGSLLVALSVPTIIFAVFALPHPQLFVLSSCAAFFYLIAITIGAIPYYVLPYPYIAIISTFIAIELARFLLIRSYRRVVPTFSRSGYNSVLFPLNDLTASIACGATFAGVQSVLEFFTISGYIRGPGTVYSSGCQIMSALVLAAWISLIRGIMHVALMVAAFPEYTVSLRVAIPVVAIHGASVVLMRAISACSLSLPIQTGIMLAAILLALRVVMPPHLPKARF